jgi:hypothetical protein
MKNDVKLTSVNILKDVYIGFKKTTLETDMNLQKLVNRCIDLYTKDDKFKDAVDNHKTLGVKGSKF